MDKFKAFVEDAKEKLTALKEEGIAATKDTISDLHDKARQTYRDIQGQASDIKDRIVQETPAIEKQVKDLYNEIEDLAFGVYTDVRTRFKNFNK